MPEKRYYSSKKILASAFWALLGVGTVVLLSAAIMRKNNSKCSGLEINIAGIQNNFFIDKRQVNDMLEALCRSSLQGRKMNSLNLAEMEATLKTNQWIRTAELFFDNNDVLHVNINEREPVARIFSKGGSSFYIDSNNTLLPLSSHSTARVPAFTGFPAVNVLSGSDSSLLSDIGKIGNYILHNDFWMAQIDQVDITPDRTFEMIPKVGNHVILFGNTENLEEKFDHLLTFYQQIISQTGWNKYSKISVQYKDQVVAVKRDVKDVIEDSLRAKLLMQSIVMNAQKLVQDSTNNIQLVQQLDDNDIPLPRENEELPQEETNNNSVIPNKPSSIERPNPTPKPEKKEAIPVTKKPAIAKIIPGAKGMHKTMPTVINKVDQKQPVKKPIVKPLIITPKSKPKSAPNNDY